MGTLIEYMCEKCEKREDKDNMFGVGVTDEEFQRFIIQYLLGEDWYVASLLGYSQIGELALYRILEKYSPAFRKELKEVMKGDKR